MINAVSCCPSYCAGNFLVCLAVWQATAAQDIISKIFAIFFPVAAFVSISFSHVVSSPAVRTFCCSQAVAPCLQVLLLHPLGPVLLSPVI